MRLLIGRHWPLLLLLVAAAALYARTVDAVGMFMWDEAEYACIARSLVRGQGFAIAEQPNHYRLPVLPLAAAGSIALAGRSDDAVLKRVSIGFGLLALAIVYAAVTAAHDRWTGLLAAALLGVLPGFWSLTAHLLTEMPFLSFFSAALFALSHALGGYPRGWVWAAGCAALALLTRYTGVLLAPAGVLVAFAAGWAGHGQLARSWRHMALGAALFGALLLPWLVRQQLVFGDTLTGFRYASGQLDDYVPGFTLPWHFYLANLPHLLTIPGALLALAGAVWAVQSRDRLGLVCVGVVTLLLVWFARYRYKELRLITATLPFLAVLIALGLTRAIFDRLPGRPIAVLLGFAVVGGLGWNAVTHAMGSTVTLGYPSFLDAMRTLRSESSQRARVVGAAAPQIAWYADRTAAQYPEEAALPATVATTDWFVVTSFERGQPEYVDRLGRSVSLIDIAARRARRFNDGRFQTLLITPGLMRELLQRPQSMR